MDKIYKKARAKINLTLEVVNKRVDGYHDIISVFQKVNLYDEIYVEKTNTNMFTLKTNLENVSQKDNIIYKAYLKLREEYKNLTGIHVVLNKKIPIEAGLAGGSTDCATFILCINKLFNLNMSEEKIKTIAKSLGADVIPCIYDRALLAEGIGDIITPINTNFKYHILILKPKMSCSTKEMYQRLDAKNNRIIKTDSAKRVIQALEDNNVNLLSDNLYNVFENVITSQNTICELKSELKKNGAIGTCMTGSGACVYGIFEDKELAKEAYNLLKQKYEVYICTSYNSKKCINNSYN